MSTAVAHKQDTVLDVVQKNADAWGLRANMRDLAQNDPDRMAWMMPILDGLTAELQNPTTMMNPNFNDVVPLAMEVEANTVSLDAYRAEDSINRLSCTNVLRGFML